MLLVVFGAGASFDSAPSRHPNRGNDLYNRPPLSDELFSDRPEFVKVMELLPIIHPIVPKLQRLPQGGSLEQVLSKIQATAERYPQRMKQLAGVRYYLQLMMLGCQQRWEQECSGITNYKSLLDKIEERRPKDDRVFIVTFNYDTMIESALPCVGLTIRTINDYVGDGPYSLVKLHGSINWGRFVGHAIDGMETADSWKIVHYLIERAATIRLKESYEIITQYPVGRVGNRALFPAISIPVEIKSQYECPPDHQAALTEFLPKVDKLLVIGWWATERPFLELIARSQKLTLQTLVVSGMIEEAAATIERIKSAGVRIQATPSLGGFTDLITTEEDELDRFLGD